MFSSKQLHLISSDRCYEELLHDASLRGEADLSYRVSNHWTTYGTLAYVRGKNETRNTPLAQITPLEGRIGFTYTGDMFSGGVLLRSVASQHRTDTSYGNIAGQDIGPSGGFSVFSVNGSARLKKGISLSVGIDNLFDRTYAEYLSRSGAMVSGFSQTTRVDEPGRFLWAKVSLDLR